MLASVAESPSPVSQLDITLEFHLTSLTSRVLEPTVLSGPGSQSQISEVCQLFQVIRR